MCIDVYDISSNSNCDHDWFYNKIVLYLIVPSGYAGVWGSLSREIGGWCEGGASLLAADLQ